MGSTPSHEDDDTSERGAHATITIGAFLVGKPRTDMSPLERRGLNAKPTRCQ
jgi:hypothetical protein